MRCSPLFLLLLILPLACTPPEPKPIQTEPGFAPAAIFQTSIAFWPLPEPRIDEGTRRLIKHVYHTPKAFTENMEARLAARLVPRAQSPSASPAEVRQGLNVHNASDLLNPNQVIAKFQKGEGQALSIQIRQISGLEATRFLVLCSQLKLEFDAPLSVPNMSSEAVLSNTGLVPRSGYIPNVHSSEEKADFGPTQVTQGSTSGSLDLVILDLDKGKVVWGSQTKAIAESKERLQAFQEVLGKLTEGTLKDF